MMTVDELVQLIHRLGNSVIKDEENLTQLDAAIGDGDHGLNMAKGFKAVQEKLKQEQFSKPSEVLKTVGMTLVSTVGGASGPLYGTAFMQMAMSVKDKDSLSIDDLSILLNAAKEGIEKRGHATNGEKTMLDMLVPYINTLESVGTNNMTQLKKDLISTMKKAKQNIIEMKATKGRASYLGERSVNHMDPGAQSMMDMLTVVTEVL